MKILSISQPTTTSKIRFGSTPSELIEHVEQRLATVESPERKTLLRALIERLWKQVFHGYG